LKSITLQIVRIFKRLQGFQGCQHRAANAPSHHTSTRSARTAHSSSTMYGGYDGSASQFAGQGGFLPTPAGGATAGADGAAGGAVRTLERRSSRRVSRPRRTSRGGDDPARSRLPPDRYRPTDTARRARATRAFSPVRPRDGTRDGSKARVAGFKLSGHSHTRLLSPLISRNSAARVARSPSCPSP
jgi:hypothetical protein